MPYKIYIICSRFTRQISRDNINAFAASTAFFLFISFIPMLVLLSAVLPYTPVTEAALLSFITDLVPQLMSPKLAAIITEVYDTPISVVSVAAVLTVWSAGKGVLGLMNGLNVVNGVTEDRNYILLRIRASIYMVIIVLATVLSLVIMVFGNVLANLLLQNIPAAAQVMNGIMKFRFLFGWVFLILIFDLIYTFIPNKKLRLKKQLPGAVFSAIAWSAFSWGFSIYIATFNSFSMYGSLATIVIIMLWLYICIYIMLLGANINRFFRPAMNIMKS